MQNSTLIWIIIAALVVLGGGWYLLSNQAAPASVEENSGTETETDADDEADGAGVNVDVNVGAGTGGSSEEGVAPLTARVSYSANGFSPSAVTVRVGGTVTWTNTGGGQMWVASASHPTHTTYSGTTLQEHCGSSAEASAFDQCENGNTFSFTFNKAGTWRYHNHSQSSHFGTVIVEE